MIVGIFGRKSESSSKPGTDWDAKHDAAGSQAQPYEDRPYAEGTRSSTGDLGDGGICHSPSNIVDND